MSKKILSSVGLAIVGVVVAVLWLLSLTNPDIFGFFNLSWAIAIFSGCTGIIYILKGVFEKNIVSIKKWNIIFGAILLIISIVSIVGAINLKKDYILPIIAIILTSAVLLSTLAVGGKKWDQGDNQKVGYKDYYQRKKDEEKKDK